LYGPRFSAACDSHYFADGAADYVDRALSPRGPPGILGSLLAAYERARNRRIVDTGVCQYDRDTSACFSYVARFLFWCSVHLAAGSGIAYV